MNQSHRILLLCFLVSAAFLYGAGISQAADAETVSLNISLVNQNPDPAGAGEIVELRFSVENIGPKDAKNVRLELVPQYPFLPVPGESYVQTISTLSAYQTGDNAVILKFKVRIDSDAMKGLNPIGIRRGDSMTGISVTNYFDIDVGGTQFAQVIYVDKAKLYPGNETPLTFTITNVGSSPLRNLVFSWNDAEGAILPVYSDDTKYIKSIDVGESIDVQYTVVADVNAVQGLYKLDLSLAYETDTGVTYEMNTQAGIFVGGETDFDVTFSESSEGVTSLSLANVGNNPAYSVTVRIPQQSGYQVSGSTSTIVGNLDKGDYTIVSFQISQSAMGGSFPGFNFTGSTPEQRAAMRDSAEQPGSEDLKVDIEYTDTTGIRHTLEKGVSIQFRSSTTTDTTSTATTRFGRQSASNPSLTYAGIAALAVVLVVLYIKRKRVRSLVGKMRKKKG